MFIKKLFKKKEEVISLKTIYAHAIIPIRLELLEMDDILIGYNDENVILKPASSEKGFILSLLLTDKKMELKTVKPIYKFFKKHKNFCKSLIINENFRENKKTKIYRFIRLPFRLEKVTILMDKSNFNQKYLFKNISAVIVGEIVFQFSWEADYFTQKYAVLNDNLNFNSKISYKFEDLKYIFGFCFMNEKNLKRIKSIEGNKFRYFPILTNVWKKCQITKLVKAMEKKKEVVLTTVNKEFDVDEIVRRIWRSYSFKL